MRRPVRVLIVDDEAPARSRLAALIEELDASGVEIVGEAENGLAALELARERRPDVMLLDISMPEVDGFDVARHLAEPRPLIIFQTAHHEHALEAFEHDAIDYVVKPVRKERLARALDRARNRLSGLAPAQPWDGATLSRLGAVLNYEPGRPTRLLTRHGAGHRLVALTEIIRFAAADGLVYARTASGTWSTDYTLAELEGRTTGSFVRVSRAELVNLAHVQHIAGNGDGSARLTLNDGSSARVSRRRVADVRRALS
jgi:DNA-binding LytR/AlgR family response regulator